MTQTTVAGRYKLAAIRPDGSARVETDWFANLVTDIGLDRLGTSATDVLTYCQVGAGDAAPTETDIALGSWLAASGDVTTLKGAGSGEPYHAFWRRTYTFPAESVTGLVAEVGVGWATSGSLFSRALVRDLDGEPTVVEVLADESLLVVYECRCYSQLADSTGAVVLDGMTHTFTFRACAASVASNSSATPAWYMPADAGFNMRQYRPQAAAFDGPISSVGLSPSGEAVALAGLQRAADYVPGSLEQVHSLEIPLLDGVLANGIRSLWVQMGPPCFQCEFDPPIPKTLLHTLDFSFRVQWGRAA